MKWIITLKHTINFIKTTSGIRYFVYNPSAKGDSIKNGDEIKIDFTVSLLDVPNVIPPKPPEQNSLLLAPRTSKAAFTEAYNILKRR